MDDRQLLDRFVRAGDQEALGQLVRRYVDFVYTVALRQVRDPHLAEDVVQAVFLILVRKARSINPNKVVMAGWLFNTTRYAAANALRMNRRRDHHERYAGNLRPDYELPSDPVVTDEQHAALDSALAQLNRRDRDTLLLRFYHGKSLRQVGQETGVSEDTARVRVSRALKKLRGHLAATGVMLSGTGLPMSAWLRDITPAPMDLAESITVDVLGEATTATAATIANGALGAMAWTKAKAAAAILALTALVGGSGALVVAPTPAQGVPPDAQGMVELSIGPRQSVDLDSATVQATPPEARGDLGRLLNFAAESGTDALASIRDGAGMIPPDFVGLVTTDLAFVAVSEEEWNEVVSAGDADAIHRKLSATHTGRGLSLMPAGNGYYLFISREGTAGAIEFVEVPAADQQTPIRVRYVLLQR